MTGCPMHHGMAKARGCTHAAASSFSKLFPDLAGLKVTEEDAAILGGPGGLMHDFDGESEDCAIPAGYIFFAQFIDHDITLDTSSKLRGEPKDVENINALPNIRTPSLDLDCVYGFGPEGSPHIYDGDRPGRLAINPNGFDLARSPSGVALIGDPRNDENIFVSQMQLLFHQFHNKLYNERVNAANPGERFEEAQKEARYHYQWLVLFDFLKRLCDPEIYKVATQALIDGNFRTKSVDTLPAAAFPYFYQPDDHEKLTMPVEFSVAAYRVGHTMVRSEYAVNANNLDVELFDERFSTLGFSSLPEELVVDWRYMLPVDESIRPRMSKAIDPLLADEIQALPVTGSNNPLDNALAFRNLLRGNVMSLPSGQAVATALQAKYPSIKLEDLGLGEVADAANLGDYKRQQLDRLANATPLFYYILRESEVGETEGQRLGPVGSAILMEIFGGMLTYCDSFIKEKDWSPDPVVSKEKSLWANEKYAGDIDRQALIDDPDYYPFDLADVVRFVQG